jgi:hypothetical protein
VADDQPEMIATDRRVMHGQAVIAGTRVPVSVILDCLTAGMTTEEISAEYPSVWQGVRRSCRGARPTGCRAELPYHEGLQLLGSCLLVLADRARDCSRGELAAAVRALAERAIRVESAALAAAAVPCPDHDAQHRPLEKAGLHLRSRHPALRSSRADVSQVPPQS